jgi:hypothetical protein
VLVQCDACFASGTGQLSRGQLASTNLPSITLRSAIEHRDCGGTLVAYDIEVEA